MCMSVEGGLSDGIFLNGMIVELLQSVETTGFENNREDSVNRV